MADEFATVVGDAPLPIALIDLEDLTITAVSQAALDHLGLPASAVLHRPATDLTRSGDHDNAVEALRALQRGAISAYVAHRELHAPIDGEPMVVEWLHAFQLGDRRMALAQAAPPSSDERSPLGRYLGHEPGRMAIGTIDPEGVITAISSDIVGLLGIQPTEIIGHQVVDGMTQREAAAVLHAHRQSDEHSVALVIHLQNSAGEWKSLCCVLTSLVGQPDRCFILMLEPPDPSDPTRVAELEQHLWRIAAIIEASGVLQRVGVMRDMAKVPQFNSLTTRQWEVLARIARGERVPTIAKDLHLSQSTVRNHLSVIFKRFGVHSQPELLRAIAAL